jgi:CheY-like chemotaxis protein
LLPERRDVEKGHGVSKLQTATEDLTAVTAAMGLRRVLIADSNADSRKRQATQLRARGVHVILARTPFEAIVKASCHLPDLILLDAALETEGPHETTALLRTCPAPAHIPILHLRAGHRLPPRVFARLTA